MTWNSNDLNKLDDIKQLIGFETLDIDIISNAAFAVYDPSIYAEPARMRGRNLKAVLTKVNRLANQYSWDLTLTAKDIKNIHGISNSIPLTY